MVNKIEIDGKDYNIDNVSDEIKNKIVSVQYANESIVECKNHLSLLVRAKNSYVDSLRKEVLAAKSGLDFDLE